MKKDRQYNSRKEKKGKRKRLHKKLKIVSDVIIPVIIVNHFMK
jgi:hypothetical protein